MQHGRLSVTQERNITLLLFPPSKLLSSPTPFCLEWELAGECLCARGRGGQNPPWSSSQLLWLLPPLICKSPNLPIKFSTVVELSGSLIQPLLQEEKGKLFIRFLTAVEMPHMTQSWGELCWTASDEGALDSCKHSPRLSLLTRSYLLR